VNTRPVFRQWAEPNSRSACRILCARNAATASGVSRTERSAALLFGAWMTAFPFSYYECLLDHEPSRIKVEVLPS
jgi:hypothetical protein